MEEAIIKLELFRIIDSFETDSLQQMYQIVKDFQEKKKMESNSILENEYEAMSNDEEREEEAGDWIETAFKNK